MKNKTKTYSVHIPKNYRRAQSIDASFTVIDQPQEHGGATCAQPSRLRTRDSAPASYSRSPPAAAAGGSGGTASASPTWAAPVPHLRPRRPSSDPEAGWAGSRRRLHSLAARRMSASAAEKTGRGLWPRPVRACLHPGGRPLTECAPARPSRSTMSRVCSAWLTQARTAELRAVPEAEVGGWCWSG